MAGLSATPDKRLPLRLRKRLRPFQSRQRGIAFRTGQVLASADIASLSTLAATVLEVDLVSAAIASSSTLVATALGAWSAVANEGLQGFPMGHQVASGPNTTFVPATATGAWSATANEGLQGFPKGRLVTAGPDTTFVPATATMAMAVSAAIVSASTLSDTAQEAHSYLEFADILSISSVGATATGGSLPVVIPTEGAGGGKVVRVFHDSERLPGPPLKFHDLPDDPLPQQLPFAEPVYIDLRPDNRAAFIALFEDGALTEDEFVALLAA